MSALGPLKPEWILELRHCHCTATVAQSTRSRAALGGASRRCAPLRDGTFACRPSSGVIATAFLAAGEGPQPTGAAL
jgi:hypothetical protein